MNVADIIAEHIEANGFDGLRNIRLGCSCMQDNMCPCGSVVGDCEPACAAEISNGKKVFYFITYGETKGAIMHAEDVVIKYLKSRRS